MSATQQALRLYVASCRERLQQLLQRLHWTEQGPAVVGHEVQVGADVDVEQLPSSCLEDPQHSVQLNLELLQQLLGPAARPTQLVNGTFEDLQVNFTEPQKLLIYEHVVQRTLRQRQSFEEMANFAQLVADTKKAHKKQRRHRKSKPTLHEEMHQLVELQMQALQAQQRQQLLPVAARERKRHQSGKSELDHWRRTPTRSRERRRDSPHRDHCSRHSSSRRRYKERRHSRSGSRLRSQRQHSKRARSRSRSRSPLHSNNNRRFHRH
ncbi:GH17870 [Drosophila grimshawi]|uniref:GH17870 n=1 Tax=Drosophila grimshawi TaxID=7222 RepID=B4JX22_DROGR|nr:GH17870 [Drosophila grimshawi]